MTIVPIVVVVRMAYSTNTYHNHMVVELNSGKEVSEQQRKAAAAATTIA